MPKNINLQKKLPSFLTWQFNDNLMFRYFTSPQLRSTSRSFCGA